MIFPKQFSLTFFLSLLAFVIPAITAADSKLVEKLLAKDGEHGPLILKDSNFDKVVSGPRDYDILVLLTAVSPQFGCAFCKVFDPSYNLVAKSWHKSQKNKKLAGGLILATADLQFNKKTFQSVSLFLFLVLY